MVLFPFLKPSLSQSARSESVRLPSCSSFLYQPSGRAQLAESLRRDVRDLDHEYPEVPAATAAAADLDHTDTLPLDN